MGVGGTLRELANVVEEIERHCGAVTDVDLPTPLASGPGRTADVELTLSPFDADGNTDRFAIDRTTIDVDGILRIGLETVEPIVPASASHVDTAVESVTLDRDGTATVVLSITLDGTDRAATPADGDGTDTDAGGEAELSADGGGVDGAADDGRERDGTLDSGGMDGETAATENAVRVGDDGSLDDAGERGSVSSPSTRDVPPFRDPDLLAEVYDSCETFAEMTDALGMDVTSETVRRYMIEHGIHEPTPYRRRETEAQSADTTAEDGDDADETEPASTAEAAEPVGADTTTAGDATDTPENEASVTEIADVEDPVVLADGIGLSEEIDVDTLIDAVRRSRTIYELKQEIGVDRADAVATLREYDLLDLVVGRLDSDGQNAVTREEVVERLRTVSATR